MIWIGNIFVFSFKYNVPKHHWLCSKVGSVKLFLGIYIKEVSSGRYKFTQEGLVDQFLEVTEMSKWNELLTPTNLVTPLVLYPYGATPQ